jgi:hypothetical protein
MPDFVDRVFDYTNSAVQGATSVLNSGYDISKNALQTTYDASKSAGDSIYHGAIGIYGKVQENVPDVAAVSNSLNMVGMGRKEPPRPVTLTGLLYQDISHFARGNARLIGFGLAIPTVAFAGHQVYRSLVPYERKALRLEGRYRYEVVLVIGTISSTFVSKLVTDLNNKGYVVFVTVSNEEELRLIEQINDPDIKPLLVDYTDDGTVRDSLLKLGNFLDAKIETVPTESYYNFRGILVIPDYSKLPKIKRMEELSSREFNRIIDMQFSKVNTMVHNGLLKFIKESNNRRQIVENCNNEKIQGGFAKLVFVNFMVIPNNDDRRLVHNLSLEINKTIYNSLYESSAIGLKEAIMRFFNRVGDKSLVDMTTLDVILHKNHGSTLTYGYPVIDNVVSYFTTRMTPRHIHDKIFDLLNQKLLLKNYKLEN